MLLPLYDPISLCMLQASAGISQGLGAKIKSCELTDQSSTTGMHHLSSFVLLTLVTSAWASIFFVLHRLLQLFCNPHDTAGSRDAPPPTILPLLCTALTLFRAEHWLGGGGGGDFQMAECSSPSSSSLPLFRPTTTLSSTQRSSPSYTHPPSQYHPPSKY